MCGNRRSCVGGSKDVAETGAAAPATLKNSGSQTGRRGALGSRETLPGAPRKHAEVVAFTAFLTKITMLVVFVLSVKKPLFSVLSQYLLTKVALFSNNSLLSNILPNNCFALIGCSSFHTSVNSFKEVAWLSKCVLIWIYRRSCAIVMYLDFSSL